MKKILVFCILVCACLFSPSAKAQQEPEKLGLPGDNLNLYATLKLFQESETLEGFEKALNDENNNINNLDLDGDDNVDYIKVVDNPEGNVHNITLKVATGKDEEQDVAVFVVEKLSDGQVQIQLIGDEDLYGKDYIIEPNFDTGNNTVTTTPNPGYTGTPAVTGSTVVIEKTTTYQIATWPVVRFVFVPSYVVWRSPWYWGYYPPYWRPWRPAFWHQYYGYHYHWHYYYYGHYRPSHQYRVPGWYNHYYTSSFRSRSVVIQTRFKRGDYNKTYTRPDLAKQGSDRFRRDYPKAPTVNKRLPAFDKSGSPIVNRPRPARPVTTQPVTNRPGVTRPVITKPGNQNKLPLRPVTRPAPTRPVFTPAPGTTRPVIKPTPSRPGTTRPGAPTTFPEPPKTKKKDRRDG